MRSVRARIGDSRTTRWGPRDGLMKLIIVDRSKYQTFQRLSDKFSDELDVRVIWDRRRKQMRQPPVPHTPERRSGERRRLVKPWNGKDYVIIHVVMDRPKHDEAKPT